MSVLSARARRRLTGAPRATGRGGARRGPAARAVDRPVHAPVPLGRLRAPRGPDGARGRQRRRARLPHAGRDGTGAAAEGGRTQVGVEGS